MAAFKLPRAPTAHVCCVRFQYQATFCHLTNRDKGDTCFLASVFEDQHRQPCQIHLQTTSIGLIRSLPIFHFEILLKSKLSKLTKVHAELCHLRRSVIEFADFSCTMLDPQRNSMRDQPWSAQIEHFNLDVAPRALRAAFNQRHPRASRFKKAKVSSLSDKNKELRVQYAKEHEQKQHTVHNFWQFVHFTDEAHFDPDQIFDERVLREEGTRYQPENMQTMRS